LQPTAKDTGTQSESTFKAKTFLEESQKWLKSEITERNFTHSQRRWKTRKRAEKVPEGNQIQAITESQIGEKDGNQRSEK